MTPRSAQEGSQADQTNQLKIVLLLSHGVTSFFSEEPVVEGGKRRRPDSATDLCLHNIRKHTGKC